MTHKFVSCQCGCGEQIAAMTKKGTPARFAHGHNPTNSGFVKGQQAWNKGKPAPWARGPRVLSEEHKANITAARRRYSDSLPKVCTVDGCEKPVRQKGLCNMHYVRMRKHGDVNYERPDASGPNNPFYGKRHDPETLARIAAKNSGPNNHGWKGGTGTLPYGPEFTKKFKALIRERDGFTCQECGRTQAEVGYTLHVHHLDHSQTNNEPSNLVTVCQKCHRRIHPQKRWNRTSWAIT